MGARIPSLPRLFWSEQLRRTSDGWFTSWTMGRWLWMAGKEHWIAGFPLAVVSKSALTALIKFLGKSLYHWQSWGRREEAKDIVNNKLDQIDIYKTLTQQHIICLKDRENIHLFEGHREHLSCSGP